mgnify:CR=1 FL=1
MYKKFLLSLVLLLPYIAYSQIEIGAKAPEISLNKIYNKNDEKTLTLKSLEGQIVVLYFWATWCSPCVSVFPYYDELYMKYKNNALCWIAITDDPQEKLEAFLNKIDINFWIGRDDSKQSFENYKIDSRPRIFIINKNGNIIYQGLNITEEIIQEAINTNTVTISESNTYSVILNGGFAPGEDPLYNGVRMMLNSDISSRPQLIDHFIIRPSLDSVWGGAGYRITSDGYVGVTYYGGKLEEIFQYLNNLSSSVWIKNHLKDTSLYDIVYWKKNKSKENAFSEIQNKLIDGLSIKFYESSNQENVQVLYLQNANKDVITIEQIKEEAYALYTPIDVFATNLETKTQHFFLIDPSLHNMYIYNQQMTWEDLYHANESEIIEFLKSKGIIVKQKTQTITTYHIDK